MMKVILILLEDGGFLYI